MIGLDRRSRPRPTPAGLWLASAACEAILALAASGALFATYYLFIQ